EPGLERVVRVHVLEPAHEAREAVDLLGGKAEDLADLAGGAAVAVGDDVRGHGRAPRAVALVDVLDHALAAVAPRQGEVPVPPPGPPDRRRSNRRSGPGGSAAVRPRL